MALAADHGLTSMAFPAISTGAFGYPREEAARVTMDALREALAEHPVIASVSLVLFSDDLLGIYADELRRRRA